MARWQLSSGCGRMLCSLLRCLVVSASLVVLPPVPYRALIGELVSMSSSVVWLVRAGEATRQQRVQAASYFQPSSSIYWLVVPYGRLVPHELGPSRLTFSRVENRRRYILSKRSSERSAAWLSVSCSQFGGRRWNEKKKESEGAFGRADTNLLYAYNMLNGN